MPTPLKYKPEYCDLLVELMDQGFSFEACCGEIGVARSTAYEWLERFPEFKAAKELGEAKGQAYFEREARRGLWSSSGMSFNATVWVFTMKNRFGWRDKQEITGPNGGPLEFSDLSEKQIDEKISAMLKRLKP